MADNTMVKCIYVAMCSSRSITKCKRCKNNQIRNQEVDYFEEANDNLIPMECPRLTYDGPAEQTAGYKCPVCGGFTNPYHMKDHRCSHCGYKLNCG